MTTPNDLAAIRARAEKATPGGWESSALGVYGRQPTHEEIVTYIRRCVEVGSRDFHIVLCSKFDGMADVAHAGNGPDSAANADFIAAARTDVPALCDEVEELRRRVAELETGLATVASLTVISQPGTTEGEAHRIASALLADRAPEPAPATPCAACGGSGERCVKYDGFQFVFEPCLRCRKGGAS